MKRNTMFLGALIFAAACAMPTEDETSAELPEDESPEEVIDDGPFVPDGNLETRSDGPPKIGDKLRVSRAMSGLFPQMRCQNLVGMRMSVWIAGCTYSGVADACYYHSDTNTCTCTFHVDDIEC
jgi:hypothetical protein